MAKDPAFLFYTADFTMGTVHFSHEEIGFYIRLLCFQHQHGGVIPTRVFESMSGDSTNVSSKFVQAEDGYFNERLMAEMVKRQKKSDSMSANAMKRWSENGMQKQCKSNAKASNQHMPTEDRNRKVFKKPTIDQVIEYCKERKNSVNPENFMDHYDSNGWKVGKNPMKDWEAAVRKWERSDFDKPAKPKSNQTF